MLKLKPPQHEQGFTLTEVLVAILITTVFVATAMQAMVIAAVMKAKARQYAEATTWIQQDLEVVKYSASKLQNAALASEAPAGTTTLSVNHVYGFEPGDKLIVGSTNNTIAAGGINPTTNTITLTAGLSTTQTAGTQVIATTKCNATSQDAGFAHHLRSNLQPIYTEQESQENKNVGQITISENVYQITRDGPESDTSIRPNIKDDAVEILMIKYDVKPSGGGDSVASLYTEVIPDAAFRCP